MIERSIFLKESLVEAALPSIFEREENDMPRTTEEHKTYQLLNLERRLIEQLDFHLDDSGFRLESNDFIYHPSQV